MVHRELGGDGEAGPDDVQERLRIAVADWVPPTRSIQRRGVSASPLGFREDEDDDDDGPFQLAEVRQGVLAMLTGLARSGPVVWCSRTSIRPIRCSWIWSSSWSRRPGVCRCSSCASRDGSSWRSVRTGPVGSPDAVTLWVEQLAPDHAVRLAMEAGGLDRLEAERVATHAGGNPLFIIEITGMLQREERSVPPRGSRPDRPAAARPRCRR